MSGAAPRFCDHCALPVGRAGHDRTVDGAARAFCCVGCSIAFRMAGPGGREGGSEASVFLARVGLGVVLSMLVMLVAWVEYVDPASAARDDYKAFAPWAMFVAATPVVLVLGVPYLWSALRALRRGRVGADLLVGLGVLAAYGASVVTLATGGAGPLYFDTAAGLATLVTVGRFVEATAKERASRRLRAFLSDAERPAARLAPGRGLLDPGDPEAVAASELRPDDRVLVRPGEKVPADGVVEEGRALLDEAALTGEPLPRAVGPGDAVLAPTLPVDGALVVRVVSVGERTRLGEVAAVLARARAERSRLEALADRVSAVFVPAVLVLAVALLARDLAHGRDLAAAGLRALSVLVIACPCALGIATPLAVVAAVGRLAERGILVRSGEALGALPEVRVVAFDKTGTLTVGRPRVAAVVADGADPGDADRALALAASVEAASEHAIGRAIREAARERGLRVPVASEVRVVPGLGVEGTTSDAGTPVRVRVGRPAWIVPAAAATGGRATEAVVEVDGRVLARLALEDETRPDAAAVVAALRAGGLRVVVVSGDGEGAVRALARSLGVPDGDALGGRLPAEKVEAVRALRAATAGRVAFVGDGLNDAPALAAADVGIAVGSGTDLARETAAVSLLGDDLTRLPGLLRAARRTRNAVRWNLAWAFGYNVVGIGMAAAGTLRPLHAALAMVVSSLCVVGNSARLHAALGADLHAPTPATSTAARAAGPQHGA